MVERATAPKICNVKIRFTISDSAIKQLKKSLLYLENESKCYPPYLTYKKTGNYTSLKNFLAYSIWDAVGKVNITGIKTLEAIQPAINEFSSVFKIDINDIKDVVVDNIFASGSFQRRVNLRALKLLINSSPRIGEEKFHFFCEFIPEKFCAAYCRSRRLSHTGEKAKSINCPKSKRGTVAVFGSGKYNILGATCRRDIVNLFMEMNVLILKL